MHFQENGSIICIIKLPLSVHYIAMSFPFTFGIRVFLLYAEKYQFTDLTKNDKMFPTILTGTRIGKYDLFMPSPKRK